MKKHTFVLLIFILVMLFGACGVSNEETSSGSGQESVGNHESAESTANDNQSSEEGAGVTSEIEGEEASELNVPTQIVDGDYDFTLLDSQETEWQKKTEVLGLSLHFDGSEILYICKEKGTEDRVYVLTADGETIDCGEGIWGQISVDGAGKDGTWYFLTIYEELYILQDGEMTALPLYTEDMNEEGYSYSSPLYMIAIEDAVYYSYQVFDEEDPQQSMVAAGIARIDVKTGEKSIWLQEEGRKAYNILSASENQIIYVKYCYEEEDSSRRQVYRSVREGDIVYTETLVKEYNEVTAWEDQVYYIWDGNLWMLDVSEGERKEVVAGLPERTTFSYIDETRIILSTPTAFLIYDTEGNLWREFERTDQKEGSESHYYLYGILGESLVWLESKIALETEIEIQYGNQILYLTDYNGENRQDIAVLTKRE